MPPSLSSSSPPPAIRPTPKAPGPGTSPSPAVRTFPPGLDSVDRNDLVKITFTAEDIAHSFTIDSYRISKRAGAGQSVTFEFRADQPGTFDYYCNLSVDSKCKGMRGRLLVK